MNEQLGSTEDWAGLSVEIATEILELRSMMELFIDVYSLDTNSNFDLCARLRWLIKALSQILELDIVLLTAANLLEEDIVYISQQAKARGSFPMSFLKKQLQSRRGVRFASRRDKLSGNVHDRLGRIAHTRGLNVLCLPIVVQTDRVAIVTIARQQPFSSEHHQLVQILISIVMKHGIDRDNQMELVNSLIQRGQIVGSFEFLRNSIIRPKDLDSASEISLLETIKDLIHAKAVVILSIPKKKQPCVVATSLKASAAASLTKCLLASNALSPLTNLQSGVIQFERHQSDRSNLPKGNESILAVRLGTVGGPLAIAVAVNDNTGQPFSNLDKEVLETFALPVVSAIADAVI